MAALIWSGRAEADLQSIHLRISQDSPSAADGFIERIVQAVSRLEEFPESGRLVPEFGRADIRELIMGNYRVVYWLVGDTVGIALVHHGARPLSEPPTRT